VAIAALVLVAAVVAYWSTRKGSERIEVEDAGDIVNRREVKSAAEDNAVESLGSVIDAADGGGGGGGGGGD
jgi:hypothetical protein